MTSQNYGYNFHLDGLETITSAYVHFDKDFSFLFILGNVVASLWKQPYWWQRLCFGHSAVKFSREYFYCSKSVQWNPSVEENSSEMGSHEVTTQTFFSPSDLQLLCKAKCFQQNPIALMRIALPTLISLAFCPLSLYMLGSMITFFWPETMEFTPKINEVVSAFLVPAGLVYAIAFGFALQDTIEKQKNVSNDITDHASTVKQVALLIAEYPCYSKTQKMDILINLKNSTIFWMRTKLMEERVVKPLHYGTYNCRIVLHV